jgi:hypothetical protein
MGERERGMAVIHNTTLTPRKTGLLAAWLPADQATGAVQYSAG